MYFADIAPAGALAALYGCGDFLNDYEGISGYQKFRGELVLIENEPIAVNVDGPRMMRRMAVDDRNVGPVNERMGKTPLCVRDFVTPICSPMHRYNDPRRTWGAMSSATREAVFSEISVRRLRPGNSLVAAQLRRMPLVTQPNENTSTRRSPAISSTAGALASPDYARRPHS